MSKEKPLFTLARKIEPVQRWSEESFRYLKNQNGLKLTLSSKFKRFMTFSLFLLVGLAAVKKFVSWAPKSKQPLGLPRDGFFVELTVPVLTGKIQSEAKSGKAYYPKGMSATNGLKVISMQGGLSVPIGAEVKARLVSGGSNGLVKAISLEPISFDGEVILNEGITFLGKAISKNGRLQIVFSKLVSDGKNIPIFAHAYDGTDKVLGLKGKVISNGTAKLLTGSALTFSGGVVESLVTGGTSGLFMGANRRSPRDAALSGAAQVAIENGRSIIQESKQQEIVEVSAGTTFYLIFGEKDEDEQR